MREALQGVSRGDIEVLETLKLCQMVPVLLVWLRCCEVRPLTIDCDSKVLLRY